VLRVAEDSESLLVVFLLLAIAFSISFAEPLQKINKGIQEFPRKLSSFFFNPILAIFVIGIFLFGFIIFSISKYKSNRFYKKELAREKLAPKRKTKSSAKEAHPEAMIAEVYIEPDENDEGEVEFEDSKDSEEQEEYKSLPIGTYKKSMTIRVDEHKRYFHKKNISKDEVRYLLEHDYQIRKYKNLLTSRMENFLLSPRFNENFTHLYLVKHIAEYLEKNGIETELYITKKPDIVFQIESKRYAIEVETGSIFSKISRMKEKLEVLENYDKWFFVVTDRNKVKKYKKYGDAVDKRYVKSRLDKLIKLAEKPQK